MDADDTPLLWKQPAPAKRGPKPKFTLDAIADAAISIADTNGLDAVTMQQVAEHLGTTKMALYRYLPNRAELDAVMLDAALGIPEPLPDGDWRRALAQWAERIHRRTQSKPWTAELSHRPHVPGPCELTWLETALATMSELPMRGGEKLDALTLLAGHVMSLAQRDAQDAASEATMARGLTPVLRARAGEFPQTASAFSESADDDAQNGALRFGIDRVLDGIQALIRERIPSEQLSQP